MDLDDPIIFNNSLYQEFWVKNIVKMALWGWGHNGFHQSVTVIILRWAIASLVV